MPGLVRKFTIALLICAGMGLAAARVPIAIALVALGFVVEGIRITIAGTTMTRGAMLVVYGSGG